MKRLFVAVPVATELIPEIIQIQEALRQTGVQGTFVQPQHLHFTLTFLGEVREDIIADIIEKLNEVTRDQISFPITLQGVSMFDTRAAPVWIGVKDSLLIDLMKAVKQTLSFVRTEEREETSHLTIARLKWGTQKKEFVTLLQRLREHPVGMMHVDRLVLFESTLTSEGPVYTIIKEFPLAHKV